MADNVTLNTGSGGDVVATEDIAGVEYQKVKLVDGTATSTTAIPLSGDLANGLDVDVTRVTGTVTVDGSGVTQPVSGTVTANPASGTIDTLTTITNSVTIDNDDTVSTNNVTTTPLGISGTYTGTGDDCLGYSSVTITLFSDEASAANGMTFEFSTDNSNWDDVYTFTLAAGTTRRFQFPITARYFRIVYTNGTTGQGAFRVQTLLHRQNQLTSIHRIEDNVDSDRSATVVKAALIAQASGSGDFVPVAANATGKLQVAAETEGAETPADADATPTNAVPTQSFNSVYNGTTWDLVREGATAGSILVDGSNVTQPVSGTVTPGVATSGGTTLYKNIDVDESEDAVKASAGQVYWIYAINLTAEPVYLKLYNATVATVVVGTTVPDLTFPIPTQGDANGAGFFLSVPNGIAFGTAITIAATTGVADNDSGAPAANAVVVNLGYA